MVKLSSLSKLTCHSRARKKPVRTIGIRQQSRGKSKPLSQLRNPAPLTRFVDTDGVIHVRGDIFSRLLHTRPALHAHVKFKEWGGYPPDSWVLLHTQKSENPQEIYAHVLEADGKATRPSWLPVKTYLVSQKEVSWSRKPLLVDDFGSSHYSLEKFNQNLRVARFILESPVKGLDVYYLDSPAGRVTTNVLQLLPDSRLHLINPTSPDAFRLEQALRHRVIFHQETFVRFLTKRMTKEQGLLPAGHIFYDVCCTPDGSLRVRPQDDIFILLHQGLLHRNGGVLAITLNLRGVRGSRPTIVPALASTIVRLGKRFNYSLTLEFYNIYRTGSMCHIILRSSVP